MSPTNGNGSFLRMIFWGLLIGSFGWTTFVGWGTLQAVASHCEQQKVEFTEVRKEMVASDSLILTKLSEKMEQISGTLGELKAEVRSLRKEKT